MRDVIPASNTKYGSRAAIACCAPLLGLVIAACGVDASGTMAVPDAPLGQPPSGGGTPAGSGATRDDAGSGVVVVAPTPVPDTPGSTPPPADAGAPLPTDAAAPPPSVDAGPGQSPPCSAGMARCAATGTCVPDCAKSCPSAPVACFACGPGNVVAASECVAPSASAACVAPPFVRCACSGKSAAACPGAQNVCAAGVCLACGDPGSDGLPCKSPADKACTMDGKGKAADSFTCH